MSVEIRPTLFWKSSRLVQLGLHVPLVVVLETAPLGETHLAVRRTGDPSMATVSATITSTDTLTVLTWRARFSSAPTERVPKALGDAPHQTAKAVDRSSAHRCVNINRYCRRTSLLPATVARREQPLKVLTKGSGHWPYLQRSLRLVKGLEQMILRVENCALFTHYAFVHGRMPSSYHEMAKKERPGRIKLLHKLELLRIALVHFDFDWTASSKPGSTRSLKLPMAERHASSLVDTWPCPLIMCFLQTLSRSYAYLTSSFL
jgi:hypothetical protein